MPVKKIKQNLSDKLFHADGINISAGEIVTIVVVPIVVVTGLLALGFVCSRRRRGYQAFTCERKLFHGLLGRHILLLS